MAKRERAAKSTEFVALTPKEAYIGTVEGFAVFERAAKLSYRRYRWTLVRYNLFTWAVWRRRLTAWACRYFDIHLYGPWRDGRGVVPCRWRQCLNCCRSDFDRDGWRLKERETP